MKIIVTGGLGFIGSHLVEKLIRSNYKVVVIDNLSNGKKSNLDSIIKHKNLTVVISDICNSKKISRYFKNTSVVFHLAGLADIVPSIEQPQKYFDANVKGTLSILELMRTHKVKKIIYAASASCYGLSKVVPSDINSKIDTRYPYALTKKIGEDLIIHWSEVYKLEAISFRFFNIYGPKSRTSGSYGAVFGTFLAQKIAKKKLTIVGNGKQKRDFLFISDLIELLEKSIHVKTKEKVFNVGSGRPVSINKIAKLISNNLTYIPKRPGEPNITYANIDNTIKIFKWKPIISIEDGVKTMLDEIYWWKDAPIWTPSKIKKATTTWFKYLD